VSNEQWDFPGDPGVMKIIGHGLAITGMDQSMPWLRDCMATLLAVGSIHAAGSAATVASVPIHPQQLAGWLNGINGLRSSRRIGLELCGPCVEATISRGLCKSAWSCRVAVLAADTATSG
jgi:hypothetical protein